MNWFPENTKPKWLIIILSVLMSAGVFALDLTVPLGVAGGVPYVAPVLLTLWASSGLTLSIALFASSLTIIGFYLSPPGGELWVVLSNRSLALFAIWVTAILIIMRNITEQAHHESEERLHKFINAATDGFILFDSELRAVEVNKATIQIFPTGTRREDIIGKHILELNPNLENSGRYNDYQKVLETGEAFAVEEMRPGGKFGEIYLAIQAFKVGSGLGLINTDVTERMRAENVIRRSLAEKEVLLKEVHHRVKNNLQIITSLLHLQTEGIYDKACLNILNESRSRVQAIALLHENLYNSEDLAAINTRDYVTNLTSSLSQTYNDSGGGIQIAMNIDDLKLDIDTAMPLGLVINELVSNAFKYAYPEGDRVDKIIRVELLAMENNRARLSVSDDGVGLEAGYDKKGSLGLELVRNLVDQIDGKLTINRQHGTEFLVEFSITHNGK